MEKSLIKYHIKRLRLTNESAVAPNFDFQSLYGVVDIIMSPACNTNPCVEMVLGDITEARTRHRINHGFRTLNTITLYGTAGGIEPPIGDGLYRRRDILDPVTGEIEGYRLWDDDYNYSSEHMLYNDDYND